MARAQGWRALQGAESPGDQGVRVGWGGPCPDLVSGDDPLARVLEQLLVAPVRVLAGQPLRPQVVVAEPEQAQRLQEGLAVPSLCPEGCVRPSGVTGDDRSGAVTQGSATWPPQPAPQPALDAPPPPPRRAPWPHRTAPEAHAVPWRGRARST